MIRPGHGSDRSSRAVAALLVLALTLPATSRADDASKANIAEALFQDAKSLMKEGKYAEACPKLVESQRLDPGGGTMLLLAQCHEAEGRIATAWSEYAEALAIAIKDGRADRETICRDRIAALAPVLPRVRIVVADAVEGIEVALDGTSLPRAAWSSALPVDPGPHEVAARAPGRAPWSTSFIAARAAPTHGVTVPALVPLATSTEAVDDGRTRRTVGFVVAATGAAAIVVGSIFGIRAIGKRKDSDEHCPAERCDALGVEYNEAAQSSATVANLAIGLGLVAVATGTILVLTAPVSASPVSSSKERRETSVRVVPSIGLGALGLSFDARF